MVSKLLFDASSLLKVLKEKRVDLLRGNYIQWLTIYEVLNALWKEVNLVKSVPGDRAVVFARVLSQVVGLMRVLDVRGLEEEILETANQLGITAYDSSYIVLAKVHGLTLVTEGTKLQSKAGGVVKVASLDKPTQAS